MPPNQPFAPLGPFDFSMDERREILRRFLETPQVRALALHYADKLGDFRLGLHVLFCAMLRFSRVLSGEPAAQVRRVSDLFDEEFLPPGEARSATRDAMFKLALAAGPGLLGPQTYPTKRALCAEFGFPPDSRSKKSLLALLRPYCWIEEKPGSSQIKLTLRSEFLPLMKVWGEVHGAVLRAVTAVRMERIGCAENPETLTNVQSASGARAYG